MQKFNLKYKIDNTLETGVKILNQSKLIAKPSSATLEDSSTIMAEQVQTNGKTVKSSCSVQAENIPDDTSADSWESEDSDIWACPWKLQHKKIQISTFNSPNDFYVVDTSPQLVINFE